jgi:hypothetical protein
MTENKAGRPVREHPADGNSRDGNSGRSPPSGLFSVRHPTAVHTGENRPYALFAPALIVSSMLIG